MVTFPVRTPVCPRTGLLSRPRPGAGDEKVAPHTSPHPVDPLLPGAPSQGTRPAPEGPESPPGAGSSHPVEGIESKRSPPQRQPPAPAGDATSVETLGSHHPCSRARGHPAPPQQVELVSFSRPRRSTHTSPPLREGARDPEPLLPESPGRGWEVGVGRALVACPERPGGIQIHPR